MAPVRDVPSCVGKGLGAQYSGRLFVTPPSKQSGHGGDEDGLRGKQTEGRVPGFKRMGELGSRDEPSAPMEDSFQLALEVEIVQHLREQNAQLMLELEKLRLAKNGSGSGDGSTPAQSWVEIPSEGLRDGWDSKGTPQTALRYQMALLHEPPEPSPAILPPAPPFPTLGDDMASGMLDQYEVIHEGPKIRMGDRLWKPQGTSSHEPTPGEARAFWLEREVVALKQSLAKNVQWESFQVKSVLVNWVPKLTGFSCWE